LGRVDKQIAKDRNITRRDFVHGLGLGGTMLAFSAGMPVFSSEGLSPVHYPPTRTGLRGSHPGSYEAAHDLAEKKLSIKPLLETDEQYDLVIVGAGVSGLSAAHYYRQRFGASAKILLLENHDDFGGHARRNEFHQGGDKRLAIGGGQYLAHWLFTETVDELMRDLGVDIEQLLAANEFRSGRNGREGPAIWFDEATYGVNRLVTGYDLAGSIGHGMPAAIDAFPIGEEARAQLKAFYNRRSNVLTGLSRRDAMLYLTRTPYNAFLREQGGLNDEAIELFQSSSHGFWGVNIGTLSIKEALVNGSPGYHLLGEDATVRPQQALEGFFPDGTASIARLLVRQLIPRVAPNAHAGNIAVAQFDYTELDRAGSRVRLRLNATALNVHRRDKDAVITYAEAGKIKAVSARHCVLACNHSMIPYLCPDLPEAQKEAQRYQVKVPLVVTNVLIRSGDVMERLGINGAYCPGRMHASMYMLKGISSGGYSHRMSDPGPVVLTFSGTIVAPAGAADVREGFRQSREKMLELTFAQYEREIRTVLDSMLGPAGFNGERDILAITVNRWPHGFAYEYRDLYDPIFPSGKAPHHIARLPWGNVAIANADAGASAYLGNAVDQAYRSVQELPAG
jgi:spermidine dehydrogenase